MASNTPYDLMVVTDATASMGEYLMSLRTSLPEIIRISSLTGCFDRIGVLAYRDYCGGKLTQWSGWHGCVETGGGISRAHLLSFVEDLRPLYGGDWPEAAKTGLAHAYQVMRSDAKTVMLFYTDAPPHTEATGGQNREREKQALNAADSYGGDGRLFVDWVSAARTLSSGAKAAQVFSIVHTHLADTIGPYVFLSHHTGGTCIQLDTADSSVISNATLGLLLAWMGAEKEGAKPQGKTRRLGSLKGYKDLSGIDRAKSEGSDALDIYIIRKDKEKWTRKVKENLTEVPVTLGNLPTLVPRRDIPIQDFSQRYKADAQYRTTVIENLSEIIEADVTAVTVNPVFGSLWRAVCNDRTNEARDGLIQAFGLQVDRIGDPDKRANMKAWLEESYDYVAEIEETIRAVAEEEHYPCVFLDPTLDFNVGPAADDTDDAEEGDDNKKFTREELLEIGRSCDYRILRRLGQVLTRLTYVNAEADLPAHIKAAKVARIPLALAQDKYKRRFWKVLLHTVLPGTMLAPRPSALLAALSLRMGMQPLREVADAELLAWNKWNTLDFPETWNTNCLSLLLEADKDYRSRAASGSGVISDEDRRLFQALVEYKLLEMNLGTTLTARIGWHPEQTKIEMGPFAICTECQFPRSVTIMAEGGICGICIGGIDSFTSAADHEVYVKSNVSKDDNEKTKAAWVECANSLCRGQYIVYNTDKLRVRPKCYYCRFGSKKAPLVDCTKCLSRIIWPREYRNTDFHSDTYECPACSAGQIKTIVDEDTDAKKLSAENGSDWLLRNSDNKIAHPLQGRTLFHTISAAGTEGFADKVEVLPAVANLSLTIRGKSVHNAEALVASLRGWIDARRVQSGVCSLCFSNHKKRDLRPACGRKGCAQRVCGDCYRGWYGLNARGRLINVAALNCPFCRRAPAPTAIPADLSFVGNLRQAVTDAAWVYGWCNECGFARRHVERVCAAGAPGEVEGWRCEECEIRAAGRPTAGGHEWLVYHECPGCGTMTQKTGGCDHITCTCGEHWCFSCGKAVPASVIYTHIGQHHNGYYGDEDDEYDDDYGDDDEDE